MAWVMIDLQAAGSVVRQIDADGIHPIVLKVHQSMVADARDPGKLTPTRSCHEPRVKGRAIGLNRVCPPSTDF